MLVKKVTERLVCYCWMFQGLRVDMEVVTARDIAGTLKAREIIETKTRECELTCSIFSGLETARRLRQTC